MCEESHKLSEHP